MKKTSNKIFFSLFLILSIVIFYIFSAAFYSNYKMQYDIVRRAFNQISSSKQEFNPNFNIPPVDKTNFQQQKIYLGFTVYDVRLDANGQLKDIISFVEGGPDFSQIEAIAREIISEHKTSSSIGNLLFQKYAYAFHDNGFMLIDLTPVTVSLRAALAQTIILIMVSECIVLLFAYLLTKWIMKPVIVSFERQKEFVADASHELKTPLSIIIASSEMYDQDHSQKWIDNIKNEAERMSSLVKKLLDLSRSEQASVVMEGLNLSKIVEKSILTMESLFYDKQLNLNYNIDEEIYLECNSEQMKELTHILIDNAIQHCDKHGYVNIFLTRNRRKIIFKVENTGEPIPLQEQDNIFERFYRSDASHNRKDNHYGLGLAIAKNIVEKHHGTISARSDHGVTTFQIVFIQK